MRKVVSILSDNLSISTIGGAKKVCTVFGFSSSINTFTPDFAENDSTSRNFIKNKSTEYVDPTAQKNYIDFLTCDNNLGSCDNDQGTIDQTFILSKQL